MEEQDLYSSDSYFANANAAGRDIPFSVKALRWYFKHVGSIVPKLAAKQALNLFFTPRKLKVRAFKKKVLKMGSAISFHNNNDVLHGYKWGDGSKNALLVHGWEGNSASLGGFVPGLVKSGYSVYAFDGPAHGAHKAVKTNMIDFGKAIESIMNELKTVDTVIAHSFGGSSALYTLAR
ncbi:MAG: alpha/beta hydrolase, partial [Bacteroidia bacterium]|nr:alpha/beta hydrolase [Bacteroidia bacterium]NNM16676.1 alpha/beta hydrolase [Bacteroidia bacterium]